MKKTNRVWAFCLADLPLTLILAGSVAFSVIFGIVGSFFGAASFWIGALSPLLCGTAAFFGYRAIYARRVRVSEGGAIVGSLLPAALESVGIPAMVCDSNGKILWCSPRMGEVTGGSARLFGANIEKTLGITVQSVLAAENNRKEVRLSDKTFLVAILKLDSATGADSKAYYLVSLLDKTEEENIRRLYTSERTAIAYIMVDNLEELAQITNDRYGQAAAEIEVLLRDWAGKLDAIIKSYERDRYILILPDSKLDECIENQFEILDQIRLIRAGDSGMSVTVSMGVAKVPGSLSDRDKAARAALDLALQRGGDQAVLRTADNGDIFFGGRTKTVQKRDNVKARVIVNKLCALISSSSNVIIMGHRGADLDAVGSAVGVARLARFCGVKANIVIDPDDRDLDLPLAKLRTLPEYADVFVDSHAAMNLSGADTLLVLTDVNNPARAESPEFARNAYRTIVIDHHRKVGETGLDIDLEYIDPSASSACELVTEMLQQCLSPGDLLREEANALFAGMLLDTHQFSRNTGTRTFSAALYLRSEGASPADVQNLFRVDLAELAREARFETRLESYRGGTILARFDGEGMPADHIIAAKVADKLLSVRNVSASFAIVSIQGETHISARSDGRVNVQLIMEMMGGGGYFQAAGVQLAGVGTEEAAAKLKSCIDEYLNAGN